MALSVMIGQSSALYACGNPDAVAYLSDEAQVQLIPFLAAAERPKIADRVSGRHLYYT